MPPDGGDRVRRARHRRQGPGSGRSGREPQEQQAAAVGALRTQTPSVAGRSSFDSGRHWKSQAIAVAVEAAEARPSRRARGRRRRGAARRSGATSRPMAIVPSRRASTAPRHICTPEPKAKCRLELAAGVEAVGLGELRRDRDWRRRCRYGCRCRRPASRRRSRGRSASRRLPSWLELSKRKPSSTQLLSRPGSP